MEYVLDFHQVSHFSGHRRVSTALCGIAFAGSVYLNFTKLMRIPDLPFEILISVASQSALKGSVSIFPTEMV